VSRKAFGYALLLSLGDMGVIALFGSQGLVSFAFVSFPIDWLVSFRRRGLCCCGVDFPCLIYFIAHLALLVERQSVEKMTGGNFHVNH